VALSAKKAKRWISLVKMKMMKNLNQRKIVEKTRKRVKRKRRKYLTFHDRRLILRVNEIKILIQTQQKLALFSSVICS